jgi:uncharacterized protein (TIGR02145 family)
MAQIRPIVFKVTDPFPTFDEVTIGTQTWMAQDLDIDDGGSGIKSVEVVISGNVYGTFKYYTLAAAQRIATNIGGWHVPTSEEWNTLSSNISNKANGLISTEFNGTNIYGFNLKLIGYNNINDSTTSISISTGNTAAYVQSSTPTAWSGGNYVQYIFNYGMQSNEGYNDRYYQVRLIKDS